MPSTTLPPTPITTAPTSQSTLPPPSTFDILPPLHTILSRLLLPPPNTTTQPSPAAAVSPTSGSTPSQQLNSTQYLSPKDVSTAASAVKIKIQNARVAVKALPDVDRTMQEQAEEIEELETEVRRLRDVLKALADSGKKAAEEMR